ncbi:MAG TPA: alkaline phosphatase family protein [Phycisphaerae bacterium]|nr:alkaline phosphatase family protein [Phycisphaerae bacterium]
MTQRVLLIGWDAADWKVITPLMDAGQMPNLERLVNDGVMGDLATLYPVLSPMLWTSIATGKRPFRHGVCGFTEPDPQTGGIRPVTSLSRRTRAIWNILHTRGMHSNVVGWWPSHPAEPIRGVMVSNHYQQAVGPIDKPWPVRPGTIHPPRLVEPLAGLRLHPQELSAAHIVPFVPDFSKVDQTKDNRLRSLAKIIAECTSIHAVATALVQLEPWDFMAVYYDAIDHFSHAFMRYHPPRMDGVSEEDFETFQHVVEGAYRYHDAMLGVLLGLAGDDVTVLVVSDHGFHPDHLRPTRVPHEPAGPAVQHRSHGIFVMRGPGVKRDERLYGASVLDIIPTVLALYGLPVGRDMDGKPLVNAFQTPPDVETIETWDDVPGEDGSLPADIAVDPMDAQEAIKQLVALGYVAKPDDDAAKAVAQTVREIRYNTALSYIGANRHADAASYLEELLDEWPDEYRFSIELVACYQSLGRVSDARHVLDALLERKTRNAAVAAEKLRAWRQEHPDATPDKLDEPQKRELSRLMAEAGRSPFTTEYLLGVQRLAENDPEAALGHLENAGRLNPRAPAVHIKKGDVFLKKRQWDRAEASFREALAIDPTSPAAHVGLCSSLLYRRRNHDAAEAALTAIGLQFFNPAGHYLLGTALHRMGLIARAVEALRICVAQNPNYAPAHQRLAYICGRRLGDREAARQHRRLARQAIRQVRDLRDGKIRPEPHLRGRTPMASDQEVVRPGQDFLPPMDGPLAETIVIVSGLPRSGTSMMMQMLAAGGLPPLADDQRPADADNERGYFEFAAAKAVHRDASWMPQARGKALKVVAHLLMSMPRGKDDHYRVVFMERDLPEVVASQRDMLAGQGKRGAKLTPEELSKVFNQQVQRIKTMLAIARVPVLYVSHRDCIGRPARVAARVNAFLGAALDEPAMAAVVEPRLYRHRAESVTPPPPPA